jgi:hypothetical protein
MLIRDRIEQSGDRRERHASECFLEAKLEVMSLARQSRMMSPQDAWRLAGESKDRETLWSVAYRIGIAHDVSPEEICAYLEKQYPQYSQLARRSDVTWDDVRY